MTSFRAKRTQKKKCSTKTNTYRCDSSLSACTSRRVSATARKSKTENRNRTAVAVGGSTVVRGAAVEREDTLGGTHVKTKYRLARAVQPFNYVVIIFIIAILLLGRSA